MQASKLHPASEPIRARRIGSEVPPGKVSDRHLLTLLEGSRKNIEVVLAIVRKFKPGSESDKKLTEAVRWIGLVEEELTL